MCCSNKDYYFNFDQYESAEMSLSGFGASAVLSMIVKAGVFSVFYFNNFFTSYYLMKILTEKSVSASVTNALSQPQQ